MEPKKKLKCILLIDDDEATNFLNKIIIERANLTEHIQVAQSGQEALDYLTNQGDFLEEGKGYPQPDLIFLDINMPAMNGWEFLDEYKKLRDEQKARIVIVMLTTSLNPDDELKARKIPEISNYKNKPISQEMLREVIYENFPENFSREQ